MYFLTNEELIEGLIGAFFYPLIMYFIKKYNLMTLPLYMFSWLFVWILRKLGVELYKHFYYNKYQKLYH